MLKLKKANIKTKSELPVIPTNGKPAVGYCNPPVEHRFKPGKDWKGNAGGRPRILRENAAELLAEKTKDGKTKARVAVESLYANVLLIGMPHSVSAFDKLRTLVEPTEQEEGSGAVSADRSFLREMFNLAMERKAKAIEV